MILSVSMPVANIINIEYNMSNDNLTKLYTAAKIFTPSAPVDTKDLFSGRLEQIRTVINGITQRGQHVIIFGERGVGKTSLANVIHDYLPTQEGIISVKVNCDVNMTFETLFKTVLEEISLEFKKPGTGFNAEDKTETYNLGDSVKKDDINPNKLRYIFKSLGKHSIVIIDEFDRIDEQKVKNIIADTIKNFSDYSVDATFVLVGVADSVDTLISGHQSIERALVQVKMPRMSVGELEQVVDNGLKKLDLLIDPEAKRRIINLSQGLPHYTHLLCLHAAQSAIELGENKISNEKVEKAIDKAIEKTQQTVIDSYHRAISSPRGNLYPQVLLACAMAKKNEMGFFNATDIKAPLSKILGKSYEISAFARHLKEFCGAERGPILQKDGFPRRYRYRFLNPMIEPFVIMKGLAGNMINDGDLV